MFKQLILLLSLSPIYLSSQLKSNAGGNLYLCSTIDSFELAPINKNRPNIFLGGSPTASRGIRPYRYKWECKIKTISTSIPYIYASDLINDTTIANPKLKFKSGLTGSFIANKQIKFILTVTDSVGSTSIDSITVGQSSFIYSMISSIGKRKEDTILLPNIASGGINPIKIIWSPSVYLKDTNIDGTRTYTPVGITYTGYRVDSLGCKSSTFDIQVDLIVVAIQNSKIKDYILNFHNPITSSSIFEINKSAQIEKIELFNSMGQKIYSQSSSNILEIGKLTKDKGMNFLVLYDQDNRMQSIKIERE